MLPFRLCNSLLELYCFGRTMRGGMSLPCGGVSWARGIFLNCQPVGRAGLSNSHALRSTPVSMIGMSHFVWSPLGSTRMRVRGSMVVRPSASKAS